MLRDLVTEPVGLREVPRGACRDPGVRERFDEHLAHCSHCVAYLQSYRDTVALAQRALREPLAEAGDETPEDLVRAVLAARPR